MNNRIVVESFMLLSFDVIVRPAPVRALHRPQPTPEHRLAHTQDGDPPFAALPVADFSKADRTATTGHFPDPNHPVGSARNRAAWAASTPPVQ